MLIVFMNFAPNKIYYSANNILFESKFNSSCSFCCDGTSMKIMASLNRDAVVSIKKCAFYHRHTVLAEFLRGTSAPVRKFACSTAQLFRHLDEIVDALSNKWE